MLNHHTEGDELEMLSIPCNHVGSHSVGLDSYDLDVRVLHLTTATITHQQIYLLLALCNTNRQNNVTACSVRNCTCHKSNIYYDSHNPISPC